MDSVGPGWARDAFRRERDLGACYAELYCGDRTLFSNPTWDARRGRPALRAQAPDRPGDTFRRQDCHS